MKSDIQRKRNRKRYKGGTQKNQQKERRNNRITETLNERNKNLKSRRKKGRQMNC